MPTAFEDVVGSVRANAGFLAKHPFDEHYPHASVLHYVHWLDEQKKLCDATESDPVAMLSLLEAIVENRGFQEWFKGRVNKTTAEAFADYFRDTYQIMEVMPEEHREPLLESYETWVLTMLSKIDQAAEEQAIKNVLLDSEREDLRREVAAAKATIHRAQDIRRAYLRAKWTKKDLKKAVKEYLGIRTHLGMEVSTQKLVERLAARARELAAKAGQNPVRSGKDSADEELAKVRGWLVDLIEAQHAKEHAREQDKAFFKLARGAQKVVRQDMKRHRKLFKERARRVKKEVKAKQQVLALEVEESRSELASVLDQIAETAIIIDNLKDLERKLASGAGALPETFRTTQLETVRKGLAAQEAKLKDLLEEERSLALEAQAASETLAAITGTMASQLKAEEQIELMKLAIDREMKNLRRLPKLDRGINIYCSFFHFSYPLVLRLGNLVGGDKSGFDVDPWAGVIDNSRRKADAFIAKKLLKAAGLPGGIVKCTGWDSGGLTLSLKIGLSYGLEVATLFSAKAGLALVYECGISVFDDRSFCAVSTIKVVATAEAKMQAEIPGFTQRMSIFKASIAADLFRDRTCFFFTDQYHWAAWLCQKWANIAARVVAFDGMYSGNKLNQPTAEELAMLEEAAQRALKEQPHLQNVMKDIAWFMEEDVVRLDDSRNLTGVNVGVEFLEGIAGAGIDAFIPTRVHLYRYQRDKATRALVTDPDSGLPIALKRDIWQGAITGTLSAGVMKIDFTYSYGIEAPKSHDLRLVIKPTLVQAYEWATTMVEPVRDLVALIDSTLGSVGAVVDDQIEAAEELLVEALNSAITPALNAAGGAGGGGENGPRLASRQITLVEQALTMWQAVLLRLLKILDKKFWYEFGWSYVRLADKGKWVFQFRRKVQASKAHKTTHEYSIPIPVEYGEIFIDFGLSYSLRRTMKEVWGDNSFSQWKKVYTGLMARRKFTGTHHVHYPVRIPFLASPGGLLAKTVGGKFGGALGGRMLERVQKILKLEADSGRPEFASGPGLWAQILDFKATDAMSEDEAKARKNLCNAQRNRLWHMFVKIGLAATKDGGLVLPGLTTPIGRKAGDLLAAAHRKPPSATPWQAATPSGAGLPGADPLLAAHRAEEAEEEKEPWCYREVKHDIAQGIDGAAAFVAACKAMVKALPAGKDEDGKALEFGSKEWREWAKKLLKGPQLGYFEKKAKKLPGIGSEIERAPRWDFEAGHAAAKNLWKQVLPSFNAYMEGARQAAIRSENEGWTPVPPSDAIRFIRRIQEEVVKEKYVDYAGYLNLIDTLVHRTGCPKKEAEKALEEKGSFDEALAFLEKKKKKKTGETATR